MSQVFDALYDDAEEVFLSKRGYVIPRREAALVEATGGSPTYGEITGQGVTQFLRSVPLQADDVLVDLGSGLGRLVLQVAASARLRRCVGLELSASRHEQACWVASQLAQLDCPPPEQEEEPEDAAASADPRVVSSSNDGGDEAGRTFVLQPRGSSASSGNGSVAEPPQLVGSGASGSGPAGGSSRNAGQAQQQAQGSVAVAEQEVEEAERCGPGQVGGGLLLSPVELRCEDLMTVDLADGSAFFLCSTAFSGAACRAIAERLARHPRFRLLVTSRALPFPAPLTLLGQFPCDFSWTARGMAYVYVRSLREAPAGLLAAFLSSTASAIADAAGGHSGGAGPATVGGEGGIAWLPSTCTLSMVPGDLMV
ncbi:hypothetical protein PLESTB_000174700 [Pleodorina starrii]|uniref:Histone-lysine N-methyltransferase, H3 lysine-79 specific n=1 Tax=Pleodorina starrii TaxID=330485 RepID=A0A9W6BBE2_9CHLO|nr:hypothetical protein PLESTM_000522100 [Pleodorina starrii]GLC49029.1 hypothetical protein PLESTB_000174700 [Pleodorina starrii]